MEPFPIAIEEIPLSPRLGEPTASVPFVRCLSFYSKALVFPFRFRWIEAEKRYDFAPTSFFLKFASVLAILGNLTLMISWTKISVFPGETLAGEIWVIVILTMLLTILTWCAILSLYQIILFRQKKLLHFLNSIVSLVTTASSTGSSAFTTSFLVSPLTWVVPFIFYIIGLIIIAFTFPGQFSIILGSKLVMDYVYASLQAIFCQDSLENSLLFRGFMACLQIVIKITIVLGSAFTAALQATLLTLAFSLRSLGKQLESTLFGGKNTRASSLSVPAAIAIYDGILSVSCAANMVFGNVVLFCYLCNIIYTIQTPLWFIMTVGSFSSKLEKINSVAYMIIATYTWWLAGEWHQLVSTSFTKWIQIKLNSQCKLGRQLAIEEHLSLLTFSNSIKSCTIALSCKYFSITHDLLSKVRSIANELR